MLKFMRAMFARPGRSALRPRTQLGVESLDERIAPAGVYVQSGVLVVVGTTGSDSIYVSDDYSNNYTVSLNGRQIGKVAKSSVWGGTVRIFGDAGNDYINMASWLRLRMEAYGGSGRDEIWGGPMNDVLQGDSDDDIIHGGDGNDWVEGGAGNDVLHGGSGSDTLVGGTGNDTLYGDAGKDYLYGGFGNDTFYDYDGQDYVFDGSGVNWLYRNGRWYRV
jgi:Ca2+-binding RTX toxin-like protein